MQQIDNILVAVDRDGSRVALAKAIAVARLFGARLELFLCDAESAYEQQHQYDPRSAALVRDSSLFGAREYLESLWRSFSADDVPVTMDVACETPLYEGIMHKVMRSAPQLVVRGASGREGRVFGASDWDLAQSCPVPLLLTKGRVWEPRPLIAAAVDLSSEESPALTHSILGLAKQFADVGRGTLEVLHAGHFYEPDTLALHRARLEQRAREAGVAPSALHLIDGEPAEALTEFAAACHYDLMVLGALTHRKALTALLGTLTGHLIDTIESDFLLVKPAACTRKADWRTDSLIAASPAA
jgi:nucleotide-binding universal stress UspA family protein